MLSCSHLVTAAPCSPTDAITSEGGGPQTLRSRAAEVRLLSFTASLDRRLPTGNLCKEVVHERVVWGIPHLEFVAALMLPLAPETSRRRRRHDYTGVHVKDLNRIPEVVGIVCQSQHPEHVVTPHGVHTPIAVTDGEHEVKILKVVHVYLPFHEVSP